MDIINGTAFVWDAFTDFGDVVDDKEESLFTPLMGKYKGKKVNDYH